MKRKTVLLIMLLCCVFLMFTGCAKQNKKVTKACVKCGGKATTTVSGPADTMRKYGISLNDCELITSNIYTAPICDTCLGPVVEFSPQM